MPQYSVNLVSLVCVNVTSVLTVHCLYALGTRVYSFSLGNFTYLITDAKLSELQVDTIEDI